MESNDLFDQLYNRLNPKLSELEVYRKKTISRVYRPLPYFVFFMLASIVIWFKSPHPSMVFFPFLTGIIFLATAYGRVHKPAKILQNQFKQNILLPMLNFLFEDVEYIPKQRIATSVLQNSLLFNTKPYYTEGEDFVRCRIGRNIMQFSEIRAYVGSNLQSPVFHGVFISASFNKFFNTITIVLSRKSTSFSRKARLKAFSLLNMVEAIKLEDPEFEKNFIVYSEDQVEARYVLTTSLMNRMMEYKRKINKEVGFSFVNNRLYASIPIKKNLFEPMLFSPTDDYKFIKSNYQYFKLFTDIVEDLDLNTRIWGKK